MTQRNTVKAYKKVTQPVEKENFKPKAVDLKRPAAAAISNFSFEIADNQANNKMKV